MILNVIREEKNSNIKILKEEENRESIQIKRIKELIKEEDLRYVSENVRELLGIKKKNDKNCFDKNGEKRRVVQVGEKFRVILYIRLSQEDGDIEDGDVSGSIKNQLLYLLDECKRREWKVVGIFCEEDISGVDDKREEWLKSIRFAEVGNTEIVLCKSQSRFTRSMEMVEKYLHKLFPEWNVRFLGLVDNADTNKVEGKKSRQINGLVNEWYVEDTSVNTKATLRSMKKNGQYTGSFAPYGYEIDPKDKHHLIPDLYAREAIKIMAGMMKQGKSPKEICEVLMRKHYLTPADYKRSKGIRVSQKAIKSIRYEIEKGETLKEIAKEFYTTEEEIMAHNEIKGEIKEGEIIEIPHRQKWKPRMIREILTDETQIGTLVQGKYERISFKNKKSRMVPKEEWIRVPHCHEANIDLETYNLVSKKFGNKRRNRTQKDGTMPLFSRKVYCSCCGKTMQKNRVKQGEKIKEYMSCKSNYNVDGHICDNRKAIEINELKEYVLDKINEKIEKYYEKTKISKEYYKQKAYENKEEEIKRLDKETEKIKEKREEIKRILVELYADKVARKIDEEEFRIIRRGNKIEEEKLKIKEEDIKERKEEIEEEREKEKNKEEIFEKYKNIKELNRLVLDTFIKRIEIGKEDKEEKREITIEWNFYTE